MVITEKEYFKINLPRLRYSLVFIFALFFWLLSLFLVFTFNLHKFIYLFFSFLFYLVFLAIIFYSDYLALILALIFTLSGSLFLFIFYKFSNELAVYLALIYAILLLAAYFIFKNVERNSLKINWFYSFRILWNFSTLFILILVLIFLGFYFDFSKISQVQIINLLDKTKFIFEILNLGVTPDTKIEDIILRNIGVQLDETTKKETVKLSIDEINKRYNLNLKPESTLKEVIAQYLKNQTNMLANQQNKFNFNKIFVIIILILILNSILYLLGYIAGVLSLVPFYLLYKLKLYEIEKEPAYKEKIKF
jgi:hypothetical protein